jgi:hypothetical protein
MMLDIAILRTPETNAARSSPFHMPPDQRRRHAAVRLSAAEVRPATRMSLRTKQRSRGSYGRAQTLSMMHHRGACPTLTETM